MSKYKKANLCVNCSKEHDFNTEMYSDGCCPYCGFTADSTVTDTVSRAYKMIPVGGSRRWYWPFLTYIREYR